DPQAPARLFTRRKGVEDIADGAAGDDDFFLPVLGDMLTRRLELAAYTLHIAHQVLIGFAGDDIGIENGGGDLLFREIFDRRPRGISAETQDGDRLALMADGAQQIARRPP